MASQSGFPSSYDPSKYYDPEIQTVREPARTIFKEYSKIPNERIANHINEVRKRAFAVVHFAPDHINMYHTKLLTTDCACQQTPYPCIGLFRFLELDLHRMSIYPEILERVRTGDKFLDLGCALGQELRHLVHDGAPSTNLYGCDLNPDLINVGYDLFNDQATLQSQFIVSDIFNYKSDLITRFTGHFDIINAMSFFHLFTWDQQILVAKCIITLLRPQPGSLLVGRQVGKVKHSEGPEAGESLIGYFHNEESWREMWEVVARETGTRWRVDVVEEKWGETASEEILRLVREQGQIKVRFVVRRE